MRNLLLAVVCLAGCSSDPAVSAQGSSEAGTGGAATGGALATGGQPSTGGAATGGASTGGASGADAGPDAAVTADADGAADAPADTYAPPTDAWDGALPGACSPLPVPECYTQNDPQCGAAPIPNWAIPSGCALADLPGPLYECGPWVVGECQQCRFTVERDRHDAGYYVDSAYVTITCADFQRSGTTSDWHLDMDTWLTECCD